MKSWIIIGVLIALMSGAAYYYYSTTQERIAVLISNNATLTANVQTLTDANDQNVQTIEELQSSYKQVQEDYSRAQSEFQITRMQNVELRERLGRHELDALAAARPGLVERRINTATDNAARCFELLSGAPLTENERNATSERTFNPECPWLWPGNSN